MVWQYYAQHKRAMPWRSDPSPYHVWVSELMLQQTQVARVIPKFQSFVQRFPNVQALAAAPLSQVLSAWSGLGYNRRAKYLWQAARQVQSVPASYDALLALPGIGPNTAGAILAYAYNQPAVFVETNIRTVFIHHFYPTQAKVSDALIRQKVADTLPKHQVREWYWALMDYGTHLKATAGTKLDQVQGYKKQSRFEGSMRQVRGQVLKVLVSGEHSLAKLRTQVADDRLPLVLTALVKEELIQQHGPNFRLMD